MLVVRFSITDVELVELDWLEIPFESFSLLLPISLLLNGASSRWDDDVDGGALGCGYIFSAFDGRSNLHFL